MPTLDETSYSREATIVAFRSYYHFLTDMFLPEDFIEEPPPDGWPSITKERVVLLGKNEEVFELMRHLPYIPDECLLAAHAKVCNWSSLFSRRPNNQEDVETKRIITEGLDWPNIPSSAFGLTRGGRDNHVFILDTRFGTVHWLDTPDIKDDATRQPITDLSGCQELFEHRTPPNEHEWRRHAAWSIADFLEMLKNELRTLKSVPLDACQIEEWIDENEDDGDLDKEAALVRSIRRTYIEHGWPDVSVYRKDQCQDAVQVLIEG
ncbi:unnamed protein product [Aureobasidium uvarum]|uniref:Uncharacterized protein n=1 Tax=Aureobasidium uvarum TaxID=2773716 RepID=A0A9N8KRJ4_9PEZI|nr:unnamed protein product [Aureobasidium uvarum]